MREKHLRHANLLCGSHKAGGKRNDAGKQVAISHANRERIGSSIGKSSNGNSTWVDRIASGGVCEGAINKSNVYTVLTNNDVPGLLLRSPRLIKSLPIERQIPQLVPEHLQRYPLLRAALESEELDALPGMSQVQC